MAPRARKSGPDLTGPEIQTPEAVARNEKRVRDGFWPKLRRFAARLPFVDHLVAAYYCAMDPRTPTQARAILLAALAYFVVPTDMVPDFILGLGFTDDATVIVTALTLVRQHINDTHYAAARAFLRGDDEQEPAAV